MPRDFRHFVAPATGSSPIMMVPLSVVVAAAAAAIGAPALCGASGALGCDATPSGEFDGTNQGMAAPETTAMNASALSDRHPSMTASGGARQGRGGKPVASNHGDTA